VIHPKNYPFGVNTKIELKNVTTSNSIDNQQGVCQLTRVVPVLSDLVVTFFRSILFLIPNGNFRIVPLLRLVSGMIICLHCMFCFVSGTRFRKYTVLQLS